MALLSGLLLSGAFGKPAVEQARLFLGGRREYLPWLFADLAVNNHAAGILSPSPFQLKGSRFF